MKKNDTAALAKVLDCGAEDLKYLSGLDDNAAARLLADIEHARRAHAASLQKSMEEALSHIPMLLRIPVRKLFGL